MSDALVAGIVAGYAIAIPVGAIAILIIHTGLAHGLRSGLAAGAGAATADGVYAAIAGLAGLAAAALLEPLAGPLRVLGGGVLVAIGLRGLLGLRGPREVEPPDAVVRRSHRRTYLALLGLTLLNPMTVVYFAALTLGMPFLGGLGERLVFAGSAFVASLSWQSLLALFGAALGRGAGHRLRGPTVIAGNVIILALGGLIFVEGLAAFAR